MGYCCGGKRCLICRGGCSLSLELREWGCAHPVPSQSSHASKFSNTLYCSCHKGEVYIPHLWVSRLQQAMSDQHANQRITCTFLLSWFSFSNCTAWQCSFQNVSVPFWAVKTSDVLGWDLAGSGLQKCKPDPELRARAGLGLVGLKPRLMSQRGNWLKYYIKIQFSGPEYTHGQPHNSPHHTSCQVACACNR